LLTVSSYHGGTLADWMIWRPEKDQTENSFIMCQISQAVKHLHELGIVHRNLKPENIFLPNTRRYPRVVIGGFGNAIDLSTTVPTSDELSPLEQHDGPHYPTAIDNWSMGALFYLLWTDLSASVPPYLESMIPPHPAIDTSSTQWSQVDDEGKGHLTETWII
jgi:calcium/calmodulin-dependent protein kinase I